MLRGLYRVERKPGRNEEAKEKQNKEGCRTITSVISGPGKGLCPL
jgi:hypothetical protein